MRPDRCVFARKTTYLSQQFAEEECERLEREGNPSSAGMHAYMCPFYPPPSHWHIGHPYKTRRALGGAEVQREHR